MPALCLALGTKRERKNKSTWGFAVRWRKKTKIQGRRKTTQFIRSLMGSKFEPLLRTTLSEEKKEMRKQIIKNHGEDKQCLGALAGGHCPAKALSRGCLSLLDGVG